MNMKVRTKTIGGLYSPDFEQRLNDYVKSELNGFKELTCFESLRKKTCGRKSSYKSLSVVWRVDGLQKRKLFYLLQIKQQLN